MLEHVVVQLEEHHAVDAGIALGQVAQADAEPGQGLIEETPEIRWPWLEQELAKVVQRHVVRWVSPYEIEELPIHDTQRLRIERFLQGKPTPYIG